MSYSEYRILCEKAWDLMLKMKLVLIGAKNEESYFDDCMVQEDGWEEAYASRGFRALSYYEIMNDLGAQEALLVFGLREAYEEDQSVHSEKI
jgi:hypothetical protein